MRKLIIHLFVCCILISCSEPEGKGSAVFRKSCIYKFDEPYGFSVNSAVNYYDEHLLEIEFRVNSYGQYSKDSDKYWEWCEKYGDTYWNRKGTPDGPHALTETFSNITVTALSDWTEDYPAGSVLDELFDVAYTTYWPYVSSGYDPQVREVTYVEKPLVDLQPDDLKLISKRLYLLFKETPPPGRLDLRMKISGEKSLEWEGFVEFE